MNLSGEIIAFTGALALPRRTAAHYAKAKGATIAPGVNQNTTLLVLGDRRPRNQKTRKHQYAETLIQRGANLHIIEETDFLQLIECPFTARLF